MYELPRLLLFDSRKKRGEKNLYVTLALGIYPWFGEGTIRIWMPRIPA